MTGSVSLDSLCRLWSIKSFQAAQTFSSRSGDEKRRVGRFSRLAIRELNGRDRRQRLLNGKNHPLKSSALAKPPRRRSGCTSHTIMLWKRGGQTKRATCYLCPSCWQINTPRHWQMVLHFLFQWEFSRGRNKTVAQRWKVDFVYFSFFKRRKTRVDVGDRWGLGGSLVASRSSVPALSLHCFTLCHQHTHIHMHMHSSIPLKDSKFFVMTDR